MDIKNIYPHIMVGTAAALWGCIGLFSEYLNDEGFTSIEIVALRAISATLILSVYLQLKQPHLFRIKISDSKYFVGTGIVSITFFNWCYFTAIRETSLSVAVMLLYTAPAFVVIMSRFFFKEPMTHKKVFALVLTIIGTAFVVGFLPAGRTDFTFFGILTGVGAGFGYALYSIFSKYALEIYRPLTIVFYTFLFASVFLILTSGILSVEFFSRISDSRILVMIAGLGFFPTVLAYLLYTEGLKKMETGNAAITAMLEPVTASIFGVALFNEVLSALQIAGVFLILSAVFIIHLKRKSAATRVDVQ